MDGDLNEHVKIQGSKEAQESVVPLLKNTIKCVRRPEEVKLVYMKISSCQSPPYRLRVKVAVL